MFNLNEPLELVCKNSKNVTKQLPSFISKCENKNKSKKEREREPQQFFISFPSRTVDDGIKLLGVLQVPSPIVFEVFPGGGNVKFVSHCRPRSRYLFKQEVQTHVKQSMLMESWFYMKVGKDCEETYLTT